MLRQAPAAKTPFGAYACVLLFRRDAQLTCLRDRLRLLDANRAWWLLVGYCQEGGLPAPF